LMTPSVGLLICLFSRSRSDPDRAWVDEVAVGKDRNGGFAIDDANQDCVFAVEVTRWNSTIMKGAIGLHTGDAFPSVF